MGSSSKKMWNVQHLKEIKAASIPKDGMEKYVEEREEREPGFKEAVRKEKENLKEIPQEENSWDLYGEKVLPNRVDESIITETKEKEKQKMELPDLPLEELEEAAETEQEDLSVQDESGGSVVFGILGAGQAGGRIAESFYGLGYKKVLAINTADHDLDTLKAIPDGQKVLMQTGHKGGAGKDMSIGEEAVDKHQQEIYERMQKVFGEVDRILVCAGGGGGTGGGSCIRLVETAKKYLTYLGVEDVNKRVGVLLTLPRAGEAASPEVANNAHLIATNLGNMADEGMLGHLIIFDNNKIEKMYPKLTVKSFWPTVNATVTGLFHMFNVLSSKPGSPTSFDPADYQRVLSGGGCMIMGFTTLKEYADGTDISKAIRNNLERGLLCGGFDISTASTAACIATASGGILEETPGLMSSLESGFDTLANITGNATVFRGIYETDKEKMVVYTMITGLSKPEKRLNDLKKFQTNNTTQKTKLYN
jgi:cell division GTPase FtsZ